MFGSLTFKTLSNFFASILSFAVLSSASLSPTPTVPVMSQQQERAIKEFHDLQIRMEALKIEAQFGRILKYGAQGGDVRQLQQYLNTLIPSFGSQHISSYFGPATEKALKQFQTDHHLPSSGVFDGQTKSGLAEFVAASSFVAGAADENTSDLENFLNTIPSPLPSAAPTSTETPTPTPEDSIPLSQLDQACLDSGYVVPPEPTPIPMPIVCETPTTPTPTPTPTPSVIKTPTPTPILTPTPTPSVIKTPTPKRSLIIKPADLSGLYDSMQEAPIERRGSSRR